MTRKTRILLVSVAVLTLIVTAAGTALLANAIPKPMRVAESISVDPGLDTESFRNFESLLLNSPATSGNRIELLENGEEIFPAMLEAIDNAEVSVTFETFEYWGEEIGGAFADALARAAGRGVAVHAVFDYIGSTGADPEHFDRMIEAGVEKVRWRKPSWYQLARFNHRTHRKLLVVDGRLGFTGGANIADAWAGNPASGGYRDNHYRLEGPVVGQLQAAFLKNWLNATNRLLVGDAYFPDLEPAGTTNMRVVNSSPREGTHRIRLMLLLAFAAAENHIRIATPYFYPDDMVMESLLAARNRGVEMDLLLAGEKLDKGYVRQASMNRWGSLLEAGIRIHEYQPSMYHAKLYIVDDQWVSVGSANLDNRSFRINDETNLIVKDAEFARMMTRQFQRDLDAAESYDMETWQARPRIQRLSGWLAMVFGPHL